MNSDMELSLLNNDFKTYLSYAIDDLNLLIICY